MTDPGHVITFGPTGRVLSLDSGRAPIPPECAVILGECALSFRKSLDYLVHQLSALDSGAAQPMTQFPIAHRPAHFARALRTGRLAGLGPAHVDRIEALQPYRGSQWTEPLSRLTNRDKHNDLVLVEHDYQISQGNAVREGEMLTVMVTMRPVLALTVAPGATMPVLETLERIDAGVTATLDAFATDFRR